MKKERKYNAGLLVPELRFLEFRDTGEWVEKKLGEIGSFLKGKGISKADINNAGLTPCIRYGELYTVYGEIIDKVISKTSLPTSELVISLKNDVIIPSSGETKIDIAKASCVIHDGIALGGDLNILRSKENGNFISYLLNGPSKIPISKLAQGDTVVHLYSSQLSLLNIPIPSLPEQKKIAECLSSLDELIQLQTKKLEALHSHKKGLLQNLFPAEGESVPRLRFPEFEGTGDWDCQPLSSCLEKVIDYRGKAPPKSEFGVPLITARNVRFGWLDMNSDEYIEEDKYETWMSKGIPKEGDILFTTEAPLGNVAFFPSYGKYALGQRIITLRVKIGKCLPEFLFQSLISPEMQKAIDFLSTGSTAKGIKSSVFVNIKFHYPSLPEQQRIADCLSSVDALIQEQLDALEKLKTHKKGLLQGLFPVMGE